MENSTMENSLNLIFTPHFSNQGSNILMTLFNLLVASLCFLNASCHS